jgi:predicted nucleic acid-binding protein
VLIEANVFVSFLVERNEEQRATAKALIDAAGDGEIEAGKGSAATAFTRSEER